MIGPNEHWIDHRRPCDDPAEVFAANKGTWTTPIRMPKKKPAITESERRRQLARLKALESKQEKEAVGFFPAQPAVVEQPQTVLPPNAQTPSGQT